MLQLSSLVLKSPVSSRHQWHGFAQCAACTMARFGSPIKAWCVVIRELHGFVLWDILQRDNNGHALPNIMKVLMFIGLVVFISSFNQITVNFILSSLWIQSNVSYSKKCLLFQVAKSASHSGPRVCGWEDNDCYSAGARNTDDTTQRLFFSSFEKVSRAFPAFPLSLLPGDVSTVRLTNSANQAPACWREMSLSPAHFWRAFLFLGVQSALGPQNNGRSV